MQGPLLLLLLLLTRKAHCDRISLPEGSTGPDAFSDATMACARMCAPRGWPQLLRAQAGSMLWSTHQVRG